MPAVMSSKSKVQYAAAVLLIISSIVLAFVQVMDVKDIASGTLMYIAQAFLLAGSIFGLEYYVTKLNLYANHKRHDEKANATGNQEQQPAEHTN